MLDILVRSQEEDAPTNQTFFYLLGIAHSVSLLGKHMINNEKLTKPLMSAIDWILWNLHEAFKLEYGPDYDIESLKKFLFEEFVISPVPHNTDQTLN